MKKSFQTPECKIVYLELVDIITSSGGNGNLSDGYQENELPMVPFAFN